MTVNGPQVHISDDCKLTIAVSPSEHYMTDAYKLTICPHDGDGFQERDDGERVSGAVDVNDVDQVLTTLTSESIHENRKPL